MNPDPRDWSTAERKEVAAHLDGDGCLSVKFNERRNSYQLTFQFSGSSKLPLLLAERYGGTAFDVGGGAFIWQVAKMELLLSMLKVIKPHVRLKTGHIEVGIKFLKIQMEKKRGFKGRLAALREEMGRLNDTEARKAEALEYWESTDPGTGR
ncbi:MAG: hypothetical protein NWE89_12100 [Candidatus Bathyarchaeota archaeon]|nr:hypothetical protein [Candidatus Bathyarchaeota archaeon]